MSEKAPVDKIAPLPRFLATPGTITPENLAGAINQAMAGSLEPWLDISTKMLVEGSRVRSVYETFIRSVSEARILIEPASQAEPDVRAAKFLEYCLRETKAFSSTVEHLLHAEGVHASAVAHNWRKVNTPFGYCWISKSQQKVMSRDIKFADDWSVQIKRRGQEQSANAAIFASVGASGAEVWVDADESPRSWIVHVPGGIGLAPTQSGVLMAAAWPWLFQRWAIAFRQQGLERMAAPLTVGTYDRNSTDAAIQQFAQSVERLIASGSVSIEEGQTIELLSAASGGAEWGAAIADFDRAIADAILGTSALTDGAGDRGVADTSRSTVLPRVSSAARKLAETLRDQWATPTIELNRLIFEGAQTPLISFELAQRPRPKIDQLHVAAGVVTVDELRESIGLPPLGGAEGAQRARLGEQIQAESPVSRGDDDAAGPSPESYVAQDLT